jgi:hypothetical protein
MPHAIERQPVKSSQIHSIGYDPETSVLEIEFINGGHGGSIYRYHDVPAETHQALIGAQSIGRYFGMQIRGKFRTEKLEPEPPTAESSAA